MLAPRGFLTARDGIDLGLQALIAYPALVAFLFIVRLVRPDIEPFELAPTGVGAFVGSAVAERWRRNRAKDRNARLAKGGSASMRGSLKGGREPLPTRWRWGQVDLLADSLRFRPLYHPRNPVPTFPLESVEVLEVSRHRGWRKRIMTGFRVVRCLAGEASVELSVMKEDLPGLLSRLDPAGQGTNTDSEDEDR